MLLFHKIEGGVAIVRSKSLMYQHDLYARGDQIFIKRGAGFIRITNKFGERYGTVLPDTSVDELEGEGVILKGKDAPRYESCK